MKNKTTPLLLSPLAAVLTSIGMTPPQSTRERETLKAEILDEIKSQLEKEREENLEKILKKPGFSA